MLVTSPDRGPVVDPFAFSPVKERFTLSPLFTGILRRKPVDWGYGQYSEFIFMRTYSHEGETWADVCIRVVEGTFSIIKDIMLNQGKAWDEEVMQQLAGRMLMSKFAFKWGPPGRGEFAMGKDHVYNIGSTALNNCAASDIKDLSHDVTWLMNALMLGVGVGFTTTHDVLSGLNKPEHWYGGPYKYIIDDSREGWIESLRLLLRSYEVNSSNVVVFDYRLIRPKGAPIRGFGGKASGAGPLTNMLEKVRTILDQACTDKVNWTSTRLVTDVCNLVGACVVAGNVRRSALLALGSIDDEEFIHLKDFSRFPYRQGHAWMSNNSVTIETEDDYAKLAGIAVRIVDNGEPGFLNRINARKFHRMGELRPEDRQDNGVSPNPCGEIFLFDKELCCLAEVYPTRCNSLEEWLDACEFAAIYTTAVSSLGTQSPETNAVVALNHRQGVGMSGVADWRDSCDPSEVDTWVDLGSEKVAVTQDAWAALLDFGVTPIGRRTMKPSGTVSQLNGCSAGGHWRTGSGHYIRRVRVSQNDHQLRATLDAAGVPNEPDLFSDNTQVYEFVIGPDDGTSKRSNRPALDVSIWEQGEMVCWLAEKWADNMVSYTISFSPEQMALQLGNLLYFKQDSAGEYEHDEFGLKIIDLEARALVVNEIQRFLAWIAPKVKSLSMMAVYEGVYAQLPEEPISAAEYRRRKDAILPFDWSAFRSRGLEEMFCDGAACAI